MSDKALQIGEKRRESKGKSEKERYTHLNAEFQRIARKDKKDFLSDQCKEIEENAKECTNYRTIELISHTVKVMLKILPSSLQQYVNHELSDVQAGFRKGRETRDQIANIHWIIEKAREFQKKSISALLTMPKPLTLWITTNSGKFLR